MHNRSVSREIAFVLLFMNEFGVRVDKDFYLYDKFKETPDDFTDYLISIKEENKKIIYSKAYEIFEGVISKQNYIDSLIVKYLRNWDFERLRIPDKIILRLSFYLLIYQKDTPPEVILLEANKLSDNYSEEASYKYINGILHSFKTDIISNLDGLKNGKLSEISRNNKKVKK